MIEFGRIGAAISSFAFATLAATAALALGPVSAAFAAIGLAIIWIAGATVALRHALALPLIEPLIAGLAALIATIGYRFVIADSGKRLLRQSFALYLAPAVIEKMLASNRPPALGGEMRNVTVYFSDIAGFSSIAEKIPPAELVAAMNEYLSAMTDEIEAHGGFVDKYFGDAIVAVFGAPLDDPDHATNAVHAALRCATSLGALDRFNAAHGRHGAAAHRAQLRRGAGRQHRLAPALQLHGDGRRGEPRLAARRLEQALRHDGHRFGGNGGADRPGVRLARSSTRSASWAAPRRYGFSSRFGTADQVAPDLVSRAQAYGKGLRHYRARDFAGAAEQFACVAGDDPAAALFLERARQLAQHSPGPDWEPVHAQEEK